MTDTPAPQKDKTGECGCVVFIEPCIDARNAPPGTFYEASGVARLQQQLAESESKLAAMGEAVDLLRSATCLSENCEDEISSARSKADAIMESLPARAAAMREVVGAAKNFVALLHVTDACPVCAEHGRFDCSHEHDTVGLEAKLQMAVDALLKVEGEKEVTRETV